MSDKIQEKKQAVVRDGMKEDGTSQMSEIEKMGDLFHQIVEDCKSGLPLFDEFLLKTSQLKTSLISTAVVFKSFLNTLQKIADAAFNTKGSSTDIGAHLGLIASRHRAMVGYVENVVSLLDGCCTQPVQGRKDEWRERVLQLEKDHSHDFKKIQTLLKKKKESIVKLEKKLTKGNEDPDLKKLRDNMVRDLQTRAELFAEQERMAVVEISCQERTHYTTFVACLKPVISEEFAMLSQVDMMSEVIEELNEIIADPFKNLESSENVLSGQDLSPLFQEISTGSNKQSSRSNLKNISHRGLKSNKSTKTNKKSSPTGSPTIQLHTDPSRQRVAVTKQGKDRSDSPSYRVNTPDGVVTARPPLPQKGHIVPKPAIQDDKKKVEITPRQKQGPMIKQCRLPPEIQENTSKQNEKSYGIISKENSSNNQDDKNNDTCNVNVDSVSSSSNESDEYESHWKIETDLPRLVKTKTIIPFNVPKTQHNDVQKTCHQKVIRNAVDNTIQPNIPPSSVGSNPRNTDIGSRVKPSNSLAQGSHQPYTSNRITSYIHNRPPNTTPIHTPTPPLPYPILVSTLTGISSPTPLSPRPSTYPSSRCATFNPKSNPSSGILRPPVSQPSPAPPLPIPQSPPLKTIADQTAKAALIRTLITERLNSCSPVPCNNK